MESLLTFDELIEATKGFALADEAYKNGGKNAFFTDVQTDSRNVGKDTLFVPLIGEFQNGHKYIPQALEKGASLVFVAKSDYDSEKSKYDCLAADNADVLFVVVENTLHALQDAAERYVEKKCKNMIKVSVTGSSGKTTTKEMLVSVAKTYFGDENVVYTQGNLNSETGLPLSVFKIRGDEKVGIFEMGMNRENEIGEISRVFKSKYGIITNIGTAHIGILGSQENIAREKRKSFDYIPADGAAFVCADDNFGDFCTQNVRGKVVKFGKSVDEKVSGVKFIEDKGLFGTRFTIDGLETNLSLSGSYNFINALAVIAFAKEIGIPAQKIKEGLENVNSISGRMETKQARLKNGKEVVLVKDCYNANLDSMLKAIDFIDSLKKIGKKVFVLADMKELGKESEKSHKTVGEKINDVAVDYVFLIGPEMAYARDVLNHNIRHQWYEKSDDYAFSEISKIINAIVGDNDVILLKGSHSMELEKLVPYLTGQPLDGKGGSYE